MLALLGPALSGIGAVAKLGLAGGSLASRGVSSLLMADENEDPVRLKTQYIQMPYLISVDQQKRRKFEKHVRQLSMKHGKRYEINVQIPAIDYQIIKVPRYQANDQRVMQKVHANIEKIERQTGKKGHIVYI